MAQGTFWDGGNILYHGCDSGEMAVYNIHLDLLNFIVCKLYLNKVDILNVAKITFILSLEKVWKSVY